MTTARTTLDRFGRVVLPKRMRDALGLKPGSELRLEERGSEIALAPAEQSPVLRVKDGLLVYAGEVTGDLTDIVERQREERLEHLRRGLR